MQDQGRKTNNQIKEEVAEKYKTPNRVRRKKSIFVSKHLFNYKEFNTSGTLFTGELTKGETGKAFILSAL